MPFRGEGSFDMSGMRLLSLQVLVAVVPVLALWQFLATVPVFDKILLPPFFFSNPLDVGEQIVKWFFDRHDLEAISGSPSSKRSSPSS